MVAEGMGYSEITALLRVADYEVHSFISIMMSMAIVLLCHVFSNILKIILLRVMDCHRLSVFHTVG